jgi:glutamine synthetase type III
MQTHYTHEAPKQGTALPQALANINTKVLDDGTLKKLADPDIYYAFERCRASGRPMDKKDANALATSIREWAQSKGCIGYSHWFSPIRGPLGSDRPGAVSNGDRRILFPERRSSRDT